MKCYLIQKNIYKKGIKLNTIFDIEKNDKLIYQQNINNKGIINLSRLIKSYLFILQNGI